MNELDSLLTDFYEKYAPGTYTPEKAAQIKQTYGEDYDALITDLYSKYAPDNVPDPSRLGQIKELYKLSVQSQGGSKRPSPSALIDRIADTSIAKTIESGLTDTMPQMFYGLQQQSGRQREEDLAAGSIDPIDFQRFVREQKGMKFYQPFNAEEHTDMIETYKQSILSKEPELALEAKIQQEKLEAAEKLKGVVTNFKDINSASTFANYVGHMAGQGLYQIPASVLSGGTSSFLMESAIIYDTQLDLIAEKTGLSREEIIEQGLDKPAVGQAFAGFAGALDAVSAGQILNMFRKSAGKALTKKMMQDVLTEATTEAIQGNIERGAASAGAGVEFDALSAKNINETLNEFIGGGIGGGTLSAISPSGVPTPKKEQPVKVEEERDVVEKDVARAVESTGDPVIDQEIDTPVDNILSEIDDILEKEKLMAMPESTPRDLARDAAAISEWIAEFEASQVQAPISDENEILPAVEQQLTPQDAASIQLAHNLPANKFNQEMLDDSEQTPAIEQYATSQQPQEAAQISPEEVQAIKPTETREVLAPQIDEITEEDYTGERNENLPIKQPSIAEKALRKQEEQLKHKKEQLEKRFSKITTGTYKPGAKITQLEKLVADAEETHPELSRKADAQLTALKDYADDAKLVKTLKGMTSTERIETVKSQLPEERYVEREALETLSNIDWMIENDPTNLDVIEQAVKQLPDLKEQLSESPNLLAPEVDSIVNTVDELKEKADVLLADRIKEKKEVKTKISGNKDSFLTAVAKNVRMQDEEGINKTIEKYQAWRESQGLKPVSRERILEQSKAEHYTKLATDLTRKGYKVEDILDPATIKSLGLKGGGEVNLHHFEVNREGTLQDLGLYSQKRTEEYYNQHFKKLIRINQETFIASLMSEYERMVNIDTKRLEAVVRLITDVVNNVQKAVSGKPLELYLAESTEGSRIAGVNYFEGESGRNIIVLAMNRFGRETINDAPLHELMHAYHWALATIPGITTKLDKKGQAIVDSTKKFIYELNTLSDHFAQDLDKTLADIQVRQHRRQRLTLTQETLLNLLDAYIERPLEVDQYRLRIQNRDSSLYFALNGPEMIATAFSDPRAAAIMSLVSSSRPGITAQSKSYLSQIIDVFLKLINELKNYITVDNNYLDILTNTLNQFETTMQNSGFLNAVDDFILSPVEKFETKAAFIQVLNSEASEKRNPDTKVNKRVVVKLANKYWKDVNSIADLQDKINKMNETLKNKLSVDYTEAIWKLIESHKNDFVQAKLLQANLKVGAKQSAEYKTNEVYSRDVDDFSIVDLDTLSLSDVRAYSRGFLALSVQQIPQKRAYDIVNKAVAKQTFNKYLKPHEGKFTKGRGLFGWLPQASNPATFTTVISKYVTSTANDFWTAVYGRLLDDTAKSEGLSSKFLKSLDKIYDKEHLVFRDSVRAAMYGTIRTTNTPAADKVGYWKEITENLDWVINNTKNKLKSKESGEYRAESLELIKLEIEVAEELKKTILDKKSVDGVLTPGQTALYNTFRDFSKSIEKDAERNARGVWGSKEFIKQNDYFPTMAVGNVDTGDLDGKDTLVPNQHVNNLYDAVVTGNDYGNVRAKQAGSTKFRSKPQNYFYDYDLRSIARKWAQPTIFDIHASRSVKILNLMLNQNKDVLKVMDRSLVKNVNKQIRSIVGASSYNIDDFGRATTAVLGALDKYTTALIATTGQLLTQGSSVISAVIIAPPNKVGKAISTMVGIERGSEDFSTLNEWLDKNGMGIQYRDALFFKLRHVHGSKSTQRARILSKVGDVAEGITRYAFTQTDKFAARLVWFSAFYNAGGTLQKPTREAVLEAERMVGVLQNMNHVSFSAPMFRAQMGTTRILVKALYGLKSFSLNSAINLYSSVPNLNKSPEARKIFTAHLAMTVAYHAALIYLTRPLYTAAAEAILGGDDDEDKEEKRFSKEEELIANAIWDATIGQGSPTGLDAFLRWSYNNTVAESVHKDDLEPFDQFLDSPLYSERNIEGVKGESLGIFGDFYAMGGNLVSASEAAMDNLEDPEQSKLPELTYQIVGDGISFVRAIPLRGDLRRIIKKHGDAIKRSRAAKAKIKDVGGEEDGTIFELESPEPLEFELNIEE